MNAYELADALYKASEYLTMIGEADFKQCANILRQQADRIEVLETTHRDHRDLENKLWKLIKEQEMKIINLSFDVAYAKRSDEWKELND